MNKNKKSEEILRLFRIRWRRWLGQKTRSDSAAWTTLLDINWRGWAEHILARSNPKRKGNIYSPAPHKDIKETFLQAINIATMEDLQNLDSLYCEDNFKRRIDRKHRR